MAERLLLVLGDQLNRDAALFDDADPHHDTLWMAETHTEATHVWCHQQRLLLFFSAMRHFREARLREGFRVHYHALGTDPAEDRGQDFGEILAVDIRQLQPQQLVVVEPGDYRVLAMLQGVAQAAQIPLEIRSDRHFYCDHNAFAQWSKGRREWRLEHFYRWLRKRQGILMEGDQPVGGVWNLDQDNRQSFGRRGPGQLPKPKDFPPDALSRQVIDLIQQRFADHPGALEHFSLPVEPEGARAFLADFIQHRLGLFGTYEDAMWAGETLLYHSRLSALLNLKLLDPRECVEAALVAYQEGRAPLNSVEGFVRQIIGWREFIRGVYWQRMPDYASLNALHCDDQDVPGCFWHGRTKMRCVAGAMESLRQHAYTHHIQRLMVLGLFAQLLGVHPWRFHQWHMAMYLDAIDWVSLPNALGMSQYGDGGLVGSKPYCATGKYIQRMSNYCAGCDYKPDQAYGEGACPFTTLYWDFLHRHADRFRHNRRMALQIKNLQRKSADELRQIQQRATQLRRWVAQDEDF